MEWEINDILNVEELSVYFHLRGHRVLKAVDGIDFNIRAGEIVGLVGESGCGKTVFSLSLLRLIAPPGFISSGRIIWLDRDLMRLSNKEMRQVRGKEIAMIFQNPQLSLNPVYTIGAQMAAVISLHRKISRRQALNEAIEALRVVKIPDAEKRIKDYPHQFSGGMCQRIMIAMALSCQPKLLIADEPTAALDVTIQAQIMDLLLEIRDRYQMAILLISHDLGLIAQMCDRIAVMYLGRIVEFAEANEILTNPKHPYTQLLLESVPVIGTKYQIGKSKITGDVPSAIDIPSGCRFRQRCPQAFDLCSQIDPVLEDVNAQGHLAACLLHQRTATENPLPIDKSFQKTILSEQEKYKAI
jgi:oligopeptide/dipeptide ABC transporter ATP-binding protein